MRLRYATCACQPRQHPVKPLQQPCESSHISSLPQATLPGHVIGCTAGRHTAHQVGVGCHQRSQPGVHGCRSHLVQYAVHTRIHCMRAATREREGREGEQCGLHPSRGISCRTAGNAPRGSRMCHESNVRALVTKHVRPVAQQGRQCGKLLCNHGPPVAVRVATNALQAGAHKPSPNLDVSHVANVLSQRCPTQAMHKQKTVPDALSRYNRLRDASPPPCPHPLPAHTHGQSWPCVPCAPPQPAPATAGGTGPASHACSASSPAGQGGVQLVCT